MAQTRADRYTQTAKISVIYSDFINSFVVHPVTNVLAMTTNQSSVCQAIRNLVRTNLGDRPYELDVGTNVRASLFEQNDFIMVDTLTTNITYAINTYEKRANLLNVTVTPSIDGNTVSISIVFSIISNPQQIQLTMILQRVR